MITTITMTRVARVVSRSEKVSIGLVASTVCSSAAVLLLVTTKAARQFLSDDSQHVPAHRDADDTAEPNACFGGGKVADAISTTKAFGAPAQPSSSRVVIESTEPAFDGPTEGLSTIDSDTTLIARDEDLAKDVFFGDRISDTTDLDSEWLADENTLHEDDCQATAQCLTDDEPEHTLHAEYDSHTIDNLIRRMATLSLEDVSSHLSASLDNVPSHVPSSNPTFCLDNVPSHISTHTLDDVPSSISTLSLDNVPSSISTLSLDSVPSHLSTTLSLDNVRSHVSSLSPDDVSSSISTLSLDNVRSPVSILSPDDVPSSIPTISLDNVPSILPHHTPYDHAIDTLPDPSQPSKLWSAHALDDHTITNLPGTLPSDSQSSKCQPQHTLVHDYPIDDLIRRMLDLSLDDVPSQLLKLRPHRTLVHDHPIDAPPKALALDDNLAIDTLPKNADTLALDDNHVIAIDALPATLTLDDNHDIGTLLNNTDALALDDNHVIAIDALPAALTLDDNHDISTLPNNTDALALDDNHAIDALLQQLETLTLSDDDSQSSKLQLQHTLHYNTDAFSLDGPFQSSELQLQSTLHDTIDTLVQQLDALSLDDDPSQSQPHTLHADTLDDSPHHSLRPRHLHHNTLHTTVPQTLYSEISNLLIMIVALSPQNFDYDSPYTTMLSTPYFEMWNLLFSTVVPRHQSFSHNTSY
ncbi:hypothetical protein EV702DRAFT_541686 [Suillus placidus]|uniref:Uncharacterized protein n=1 Tax=Suillus placidus TaxID=48579 RepID=A0A9P6ZR62_9AGAM|nr:hypothetical protein EV702DRAFT_541686 [Suillus placidus]